MKKENNSSSGNKNNHGNSFIDPVKIIKEISIEKGIKAADFGCGSGYFTVPLAQFIGEEGMVYALDILSSALESVKSKAKMLGICNIEIRRVNLENEKGSTLSENSLALVVLKDIVFQNGKKGNIIKEAHRVLTPKGKLLVVEWKIDENNTVGPPRESRIDKEELKKIIITHKFEIKKEVSAGDFHYGFIAIKK